MLVQKLTEGVSLKSQSLNFMCHEYISKEFKFLNPLIFICDYFVQLQQKNDILFLKATNLKAQYLTYQFFMRFLPPFLLKNPPNLSHELYSVLLVIFNVSKETLIQKII